MVFVGGKGGIVGWLKALFADVPAKYKEDFEKVRVETNVSRMRVFALYVIAIQIILNVINIVKPSGDGGGESGDILPYIILSLGTLVLGIVYFILLHLAKKDIIKSLAVKRFLSHSLLWIYVAIQMVFCTLNIISTGGVNSYIIAILIVGVFPVIKPQESLSLILLSFAYMFLAMYWTRGISTTWDSIWLTDVWTNLFIITGLIMCSTALVYRMFVTNYLQSVHLSEANDGLKKINGDLEKANEQLEVVANIDPLTGIPNRYAFNHQFELAWRRAATKNEFLAVAVLDVDHFKDYNDNFGHLEGDKCLSKVAKCLQDSFRRENDLVCRFGGEEFAVVINADEKDAFAVIDRARKNVEELRMPHFNTSVSKFVTISAGICAVIPKGEIGTMSTDVFRYADEALYMSKTNGRNRTTYKEYDLDN